MTKIKTTPETISESRTSAIMTLIATLGLLLILVATALPLLHGGMGAARWIYVAGAAMTVIGRLSARPVAHDLRLKRLYRLEMWSSLFFAAGVFFMFYNETSGRDWIAFTLAGAFIQGYTSVMIPRAIKKAGEEVRKSKKS